jgi:hypothetical protein
LVTPALAFKPLFRSPKPGVNESFRDGSARATHNPAMVCERQETRRPANQMIGGRHA